MKFTAWGHLSTVGLASEFSPEALHKSGGVLLARNTGNFLGRLMSQPFRGSDKPRSDWLLNAVAFRFIRADTPVPSKTFLLIEISRTSDVSIIQHDQSPVSVSYDHPNHLLQVWKL